MQPATACLLEQLVFSRPYFDPAGLIVALHDGIPVGFAHAGFGANDEQNGLATDTGTTYQLMVRAEHRDSSLAAELLAHSEAYLRERGAKVIYAGGIRPINAFYLGLYGGSELPGVLVGDTSFHAACSQSGYREIDRVHILQLELACFRRQSRAISVNCGEMSFVRRFRRHQFARGGKPAPRALSSVFVFCSRGRAAASRWPTFGSGISNRFQPPGVARPPACSI